MKIETLLAVLRRLLADIPRRCQGCHTEVEQERTAATSASDTRHFHVKVSNFKRAPAMAADCPGGLRELQRCEEERQYMLITTLIDTLLVKFSKGHRPEPDFNQSAARMSSTLRDLCACTRPLALASSQFHMIWMALAAAKANWQTAMVRPTPLEAADAFSKSSGNVDERKVADGYDALQSLENGLTASVLKMSLRDQGEMVNLMVCFMEQLDALNHYGVLETFCKSLVDLALAVTRLVS